MSKPRARLATTWPTRPMPMMPIVLPVTWVPTMKLGLQSRHWPARTRRSPSLARRAAPSSSRIAISAVASLSTSGRVGDHDAAFLGGRQVDVIDPDRHVGDDLYGARQAGNELGREMLGMARQDGVGALSQAEQLVGVIEPVLTVKTGLIVPRQAGFHGLRQLSGHQHHRPFSVIARRSWSCGSSQQVYSLVRPPDNAGLAACFGPNPGLGSRGKNWRSRG